MKNYINQKKLAIFLSLAISFLFFEIIYLIIGIDFEKISDNTYLILIISKYIVFLIIFYLMYHKYLKEKWIDFKINFKKYAKISFRDWVIGFIFMITSNIIISSFIKGLGENEEGIQNIISQNPWVAFIMTSFLAPIIEEMIFRKSLKDAINNKYLFMILSGLIFGLIHVIFSSNPWEYLLIIPYGSMGFVFAKTLNETDNIYTTIMVHAFHNAMLTLLAVI